jgi:uncharacterized membrane protein (DUF2068 family)
MHAATLPTPAPRTCRVASHLQLLGILWLAYSALQLISGWFLSSLFTRFFDWSLFAPHIPFFLGGLLRTVGWLLVARGVLGIIAGWGLLDRQPWARIPAIVVGILTLFHPLIGTALGVYTLWVLMPSDSEREYRQISRPA